VPIGTSLSGGLDSSTVVAFCDKIASDQYAHTCFTAVFPGFEKDEQQHATLVANQFNLQHQLIAIKETKVVDIMEAMMKQQEEPMVSASALAQYKVYEAAKQAGITVLLDGQGADEILAGYHKYYSWFWMELYKKNQASLNDELNAARKLGVKQTFGINAKLAARLPQFSAALQQSQKKKNAFRHSDLNRDFSFSNKENLYYSLPPHFDLNSALHFNTFQYGLEDLLRLADRNSMAHGIEIRLPFLSHELVAFLFTLPPSLKIHHGWTKWLLRKVAEPLLPKEIVWRKDKVGFEPPQKLWMQNKQVQEAIQAGKKILSDQDILNASAVNKKIQPHDAHVAENNDWKYWAASFLYNP
jgi:asparagine synthase (glutamine-hydrolysing)